MAWNKRTGTVAVFAAALLTVAGWALHWGVGVSADYVQEIRKNIEIFGLVYQEISKKYVQPVDPDRFMKAGINGMLETLDPYTVLIEQEANSHLQIITTGKYGGLGMKIGLRDGMPTVVEQPFEDDPAGKAGIREGDRIVEVNGESTKKLSINDVAAKLRGEIGSAVTIKIEREGELEPMEFRLIRAEITVLDVSYSGIVTDGVGYVKLSGFSKNAGYEIQQAVRDLKSKGATSLILDLRSNPGGLLDAAVSVAENFVKKGDLVVATKGRVEGSAKEYLSEKEPVAGTLPLVVLVNEFSASASEIVAGAIQDLDRGVIVGAPTFGKGLVQTVVPITRDAALKITTAKYYTPSGRLIQRPDRLPHANGNAIIATEGEEESEEMDGHAAPQREAATSSLSEDSTTVYRTRGGREVHGGGGIRPDLRLDSPRLSRYEDRLLRKSMMFQFALIYAHQHPNLPRDFKVDETLMSEFRKFVEEKHFSYVSESEEALTGLKNIAKEEGYLDKLTNEISALEQALLAEKTDDFARSHNFIARELRKEIAAKLFGTRARVEATLNDDPVFNEALNVLRDHAQYNGILAVATKK
ncbi:MAG: S41 family peptidase [bacterium]